MTHLARQIKSEDFSIYDLILVMDQDNFKNVMQICPLEHKTKIKMLTDYCNIGSHQKVPDPYFGSEADFELVIDIIEEAWQGFQKAYFPSEKP